LAEVELTVGVVKTKVENLESKPTMID